MATPNAPPPSYETAYTNQYPSGYGYNQQASNDIVPPTTQCPPAYKDHSYQYNQPGYNASESNVGFTNTGYGLGSNSQAVTNTSTISDVESNSWAGASFSSKAIRLAFIRKVYLILFAQLSVTLIFIAIFIFVKDVKIWVQQHGWFYYISYAVFLVTYIILVCCPAVRRKYPGNFICLGIFTCAFSYMVATISSFYDTKIVLIAVAITAAVCLGVTCFAIQTKWDFTMCGGLLFMLVLVFMMFGISCLIVYLVAGYNYILNCVYGGLGALLFSLFLAYDTQMLIGGRKIELSPEEYIFGALQLYLDVCYIFLYILSIFGSSN